MVYYWLRGKTITIPAYVVSKKIKSTHIFHSHLLFTVEFSGYLFSRYTDRPTITWIIQLDILSILAIWLQSRKR